MLSSDVNYIASIYGQTQNKILTKLSPAHKFLSFPIIVTIFISFSITIDSLQH